MNTWSQHNQKQIGIYHILFIEQNLSELSKYVENNFIEKRNKTSSGPFKLSVLMAVFYRNNY